MPTEPTMHAPRAATAAVACAGVLGGTLVAVAAALGLGGDRSSVLLAAVTVLASGLTAFLPVILGGSVPLARWGLLATVGTMAQPLLAAAIGYGFAQTKDVMKQPFWVGCLAGALIVLVVQAAWSIRTLARAQREWDQAKSQRLAMEAV